MVVALAAPARRRLLIATTLPNSTVSPVMYRSFNIELFLFTSEVKRPVNCSSDGCVHVCSHVLPFPLLTCSPNVFFLYEYVLVLCSRTVVGNATRHRIRSPSVPFQPLRRRQSRPAPLPPRWPVDREMESVSAAAVPTDVSVQFEPRISPPYRLTAILFVCHPASLHIYLPASPPPHLPALPLPRLRASTSMPSHLHALPSTSSHLPSPPSCRAADLRLARAAELSRAELRYSATRPPPPAAVTAACCCPDGTGRPCAVDSGKRLTMCSVEPVQGTGHRCRTETTVISSALLRVMCVAVCRYRLVYPDLLTPCGCRCLV